jgi:hypothetical protein
VRWFSTPTVFLDDDDDAFAWWVTNYTHFRRAALAAKDFLPIPRDSVPFERAFSAAGRLVTLFRISVLMILFKHMYVCQVGFKMIIWLSIM